MLNNKESKFWDHYSMSEMKILTICDYFFYQNWKYSLEGINSTMDMKVSNDINDLRPIIW